MQTEENYVRNQYSFDDFRCKKEYCFRDQLKITECYLRDVTKASPVKNFIDRLNLRELQIYQSNLLQKVQRNTYQSGKSSFK